LNGIFGVLFSAIAVLVSIYAGISVNFYAAAFMYAGLILIIRLLRVEEIPGIPKSSDRPQVPTEAVNSQ
jgi:hypothetical protein